MSEMRILSVAAVLALGLWGAPVLAADQKVTLMLGGKHCEHYLGDVEAALKKVAGVKAVDTKSMKGHVIVTVDGGKATGKQLADAVGAVKGDGWHCKADPM